MSEKTGNVMEGVMLEVGHVVPVTSFNFGDSRLYFRPDGTATFEGKADEAAKKFFDLVIDKYVHQFALLRNQNARLQGRIEELEREKGI